LAPIRQGRINHGQDRFPIDLQSIAGRSWRANKTAEKPMHQQDRLAADIGGTFTDVAAFEHSSGRLLLGKSLSTPRNMVEGIASGVTNAGTSFAAASTFLHGSTVAINTLLERKGAATALLITQGFRDIYEIGRINRPDAYNLFFRKHVPLVRRSLRFEVRERLLADGSVNIPLDEAGVHGICDRLEALQIEAVAILLLHCYTNPAHEIAVKKIVSERLPDAFVTASHELSQEYREFERCSTTVANAYVGPVVSRYIGGIEKHIEKAGFNGTFMVVQSTGGLYNADQARSECVRMLESGPAAGVIGAQAICHELGLTNAIAFDMGGTTAKAGVILDGEVITTTTAMVGGYNEGLPIQMPLIDVFEVGTGGGSIASIDIGGALKVGPRSAGAEPGPACYGRGGQFATVTDANLVLGRLSPERFLGGEMQLDLDAARRVVASEVADPLGVKVEEAADGILKIAVTKMSYAVKGVSVERGLDAASFTMIAYGGAGPLHANAIAREIGIGRVIIPCAPGHFCAFGMLHSNLRYDNVRTWLRPLDGVSFEEIGAIFEELAAKGYAALAKGNARPSRVQTVFAADMRYVGQEHPVTVEFPSDIMLRGDRTTLKERFDEVHAQRYGTSAPEEPAEIVSLRASIVGLMEKPPIKEIETGPEALEPMGDLGLRKVYFGAEYGFVATPAVARSTLRAGNRLVGPVLVEEHASTTVVLPGDVLTVDRLGNLVIEIKGAH